MDPTDVNRGEAARPAPASTSASTSGSCLSRIKGESMSAASRAVTPPIRYTGCGPKVRSTRAARMYAIARPHDRTASKAAIVRLRSASGVRRCMIPFSATIVMPSLVPMISRHTRATGNTGAHPTPNAAIAIPKDAIASHTGSVRAFMNRPQAAPRTDPVPQHVMSSAKPMDPVRKDSASGASATMLIPMPRTNTNHAIANRRSTDSRQRNASPARMPVS